MDELLPTTTDTSEGESDERNSDSDSEDETPSYVKQINKLANQMRANGKFGCSGHFSKTNRRGAVSVSVGSLSLLVDPLQHLSTPLEPSTGSPWSPPAYECNKNPALTPIGVLCV